jgi:predicted outer membrane repeat protein
MHRFCGNKGPVQGSAIFTAATSTQIMQVWIGASIPDCNEALAILCVVLAFSCMFIKGLMESEK